ncbi:MAG: hypothetical protein JWO13_467 [Acidobacteriales bacterium]|nr:hypothetical protein [Terriglobales bacterium]
MYPIWLHDSAQANLNSEQTFVEIVPFLSTSALSLFTSFNILRKSRRVISCRRFSEVSSISVQYRKIAMPKLIVKRL